MDWIKDKKATMYQAYSEDNEKHAQIPVEELRSSTQEVTKRTLKKEPSRIENKFGFLGKDPDQSDEGSLIHDLDQKVKWRHNLGEFLEGHKLQSFMAILLFMDVFCVVVELLISTNIIRNDTESAVRAEESLHICSLFILCLFALEICLLIVSFGLSFFKHPWYVLDFIVIFSSLFLDIFLHSDEAELLLILRLWRVVRILHGLYTIREIDHKEKENLRKKVEHLEKELEEKRNYISTLEKKLGIPSSWGDEETPKQHKNVSQEESSPKRKDRYN